MVVEQSVSLLGGRHQLADIRRMRQSPMTGTEFWTFLAAAMPALFLPVAVGW